jgi:hypothetical protein
MSTSTPQKCFSANNSRHSVDSDVSATNNSLLTNASFTSKKRTSEDVVLFDESSSVSKLATKKLVFSPGDTTITDDTVLDDFDYGEDISDSELKERFKNENW